MNELEEQKIRNKYKSKFISVKFTIVGFIIGIIYGIGQVPKELMKIPKYQNEYGNEALSYIAVEPGFLGIIAIGIILIIFIYIMEDDLIDSFVEDEKETKKNAENNEKEVLKENYDLSDEQALILSYLESAEKASKGESE